MWFWKPKQDPYLELAALEKLGVDGVLTDNTPTGSKMQFFYIDAKITIVLTSTWIIVYHHLSYIPLERFNRVWAKAQTPNVLVICYLSFELVIG